jgi:predicted ATPase
MQSTNKLFVCSYQDSVSRTELVSNLLANADQKERLRVKDVGLRSLSLDATNQLLSEMLEKDESATMRLSEGVLLKTHGNALLWSLCVYTL